MTAMSTDPQTLAQRWSAVMMGNYGVPRVQLAAGRGCIVTDVDGRDYLDLLGGIAVNVLGHAHPAIAFAVAEQMTRLTHTSNLYAHEPGLVLAEKLVQLAQMDARVFFCQDGATANEAALKIARRHGYSLALDGSKQVIVAAENSFHGRTFGALAITGSTGKREPFAPFAHDVRFVPFGDATALAAAVDSSVAAVVLEPIQGEGGVVVPPADYLQDARAITEAHQALLMVDEVQSGIGRTGAWFASRDAGVAPDVITLAKGLGGGLPIGAVIAAGQAATALQPGDHGSTFGGNPVSCAAAMAVITTIEEHGLLANAASLGELFQRRLAALSHPMLAGVRGRGLWQAIVLTVERASDFEAEALARGFLVNAVKPDAVRIAPALNITEQQLTTFIDEVPEILDAIGE